MGVTCGTCKEETKAQNGGHGGVEEYPDLGARHCHRVSRVHTRVRAELKNYVAQY